MNRVFETERLILKVLEPSDAPMVLDYYMQNKDFLSEWEPLRNNEFYTLEFHEKQLLSDFESFENGNSLRFWIFLKDNNEKVIGSFAISNIIRGAFQSCHLGYKLDGAEIRKGYMTEALLKGIQIAFEEYKLHRIEANVMPKNKASLRVVEKLGFYNEGLAYKYLKINNKWEDHIHMVLLNHNV
ncbi:MAG: Ribosomal-protein-alanine N-acetyltransferase [Clostridiales bacterium]|jgi:ribosomal-protein-alanine N-acetyltransferase|nr:Ribosomal-protein-alanine N-acetyltransferase [Clostridiales bacterium]